MAINRDTYIHSRYHLKPSRIRFVFQYSVLCVILVLCFMSLNIIYFSLSCVLLIFSLYRSKPKKKPIAIQQLDHTHWSILYVNNKEIDSVQIKTIIHNYIYIVIYFNTNQQKPVVIFCDELSKKSYKSLILRSKMH